MLKRICAIAVLVAAFVYFLQRGPILPRGERLWDYAVCSASAYLWLHGADPFHHPGVIEAWASRGPPRGFENDVAWLRAIVPPSTLVVMAPFGILPLLPGAILYIALTIGLFAYAAWCCARWAGLSGLSLCWFFAACLVSIPATYGLYSGNPVMLAVPLMLIGLYRSREEDDVLGGVLLGVGTAAKLQIGVPLMLFWLVWRRWKTVGVAAVTFAVVAAIGVGRLKIAGIDWWSGWVENIRLTNSLGGLNDYAIAEGYDDRLNLQVPLWWLSGSRAVATWGTYLVWLVPGLVFGGLVLAMRWVGRVNAVSQRPATLLSTGIAGVLLLIPLYHRAYDAVVLLPLLAFVVSGLATSSDRTTRRCLIVMALLLVSLAIPQGVPGLLERRQYLPASLTGSLFWRAFAVPLKAWCTLLLTVPALILLWRMRKNHAPGFPVA